MKKLQTHIALLLIISGFHFGCTYDYIISDCAAETLERGDWIPYRGQKLPEYCFSMLLESEWKGETYFDVSGNCVDMISIPIRCDGTPLCLSFSDPVLETFWREASGSKIIGFRE